PALGRVCGVLLLCTCVLFRILICGVLFFFFKAEDGIRVWSVTGVQTCALPILIRHFKDDMVVPASKWRIIEKTREFAKEFEQQRSEERRVGKEWRSRWSAYH